MPLEGLTTSWARASLKRREPEVCRRGLDLLPRLGAGPQQLQVAQPVPAGHDWPQHAWYKVKERGLRDAHYLREEDYQQDPRHVAPTRAMEVGIPAHLCLVHGLIKIAAIVLKPPYLFFQDHERSSKS